MPPARSASPRLEQLFYTAPVAWQQTDGAIWRDTEPPRAAEVKWMYDSQFGPVLEEPPTERRLRPRDP